jgi:hypothetical protein
LGEQLAFRPLYGAVATGMASAVASQIIKGIRDKPLRFVV